MQTSQENHRSSTPQSNLLQLKHEYAVPVEQLFAAFTTPEALKRWWWPNGVDADRIDLEFREGGGFFISMRGNKNFHGMTGEFEEIVPNERLVMTDQFADENGRPISAKEAKMPGEWADVCYITFDFDSLDANRSRVRLSQQGIPNEMQKDCLRGWTEMFEKLERYLSKGNSEGSRIQS